MSLDFLKKQLFAVDGLTLTVGGVVVILVLAYLLIWMKRK